MSVENLKSQNQNTGFSANPVTVVQEVVKQKHAVKRAVNDVLDDTFEKVTEAAAAPVEKTLLNSVAPVRRVISLPDMVSQGDVAAAVGLGALTVVSLPEDCRDLRDAYRHSKSVLTRSRYSNAYNYRKYQHDFSFFVKVMHAVCALTHAGAAVGAAPFVPYNFEFGIYIFRAHTVIPSFTFTITGLPPAGL